MGKNINWAATDLVKRSIFHAAKLCEGAQEKMTDSHFWIFLGI